MEINIPSCITSKRSPTGGGTQPATPVRWWWSSKVLKVVAKAFHENSDQASPMQCKLWL